MDAFIIDNDGLNLNGSGPANYYIKTGTSMACPYAAGIGALVLEANPSFTPADVYAALTGTASQFGSPDSNAGYGLLDAVAALQVDVVAPSVTGITRLTPADELTNATQVTFAVAFDESVTGVATNNFSVDGSDDQSGATVASVGGSGEN